MNSDTNKADKNDFSKGSVTGNILRMAGPMTLAQLLNVLYNIVDRIYIGRIPGAGTLALTGIGICFPLISMISAFSDLFGIGGGPLCSIARGQKDEKRAGQIMGTAFFMLIFTGLAVTAIIEIFEMPILTAFGASSETMGYAAPYMRIYAAGSLFVMISLGMNPFINSQGFARVGMMTVGIGSVLNIILDPILIFWAGMGISGAAWATVISQAVSAVWVLHFLTGKKIMIRLTWENIRFRGGIAREICTLGLSGFIINFTNSAVQLVCNRMLGIFGGDIYIGVMTVINSIRNVVQLPIMGISNGAEPVMGYNFGANAFDRVKACIRVQTVISLVYSSLAWLSIVFFPRFWIGIFSTDAELIEYGVPSLQMYFFGFIMMSFQIAGQQTFRGLGMAKYSIFFSVFRKIIIVVPLTIILPYVGGLGVAGVFLAEPISNVVGGVVCYLTMYFRVYRRLGKEKIKTTAHTD